MNEITGWVCPKCGRVHAPWVANCECTNMSTYACVSTCEHDWECTGATTTGVHYVCRKCGAQRHEKYQNVGI